MAARKMLRVLPETFLIGKRCPQKMLSYLSFFNAFLSFSIGNLAKNEALNKIFSSKFLIKVSL